MFILIQLSEMHGAGRVNLIQQSKYVTVICHLLYLSATERIRVTDLLNSKILHRNFIVVDLPTKIYACLKFFK